MKISEVIARLEYIKNLRGDLSCFTKREGDNAILLQEKDIIAMSDACFGRKDEGSVYFVSWNKE
jgi:hypothetical protein